MDHQPDPLTQQLQARAAALRAEADRIDQALALLSPGSTPASPRSPRGRGTRKTTKPGRGGEPRNPPPAGGKRAAHRAQLREKLQGLLAKTPELSVSEASRKTKASWDLCSQLLKELRPGT